MYVGLVRVPSLGVEYVTLAMFGKEVRAMFTELDVPVPLGVFSPFA